MADLRTTLFNTEMASPFVLASGPLSYDAHGLRAAFRAGGVTTKTLRLERAVNPIPHMVLPAVLFDDPTRDGQPEAAAAALPRRAVSVKMPSCLSSRRGR
ncbi:MAG: hypothetical protein HY023_05805 [Chloroflexi bacterium]|nr:hypothetical protein [Chloroflexota bacterium]MBI3764791.1 hypothetical protein [Chloroflexota bacterium]